VDLAQQQEYQPRLDILVNCAGVIFSGDLETTFPQDHDYLMDVNVRAPFVLMNFFQDMLIAGQGCVVNVSCMKGSKPQPGLTSYCMSKAGLEMLTKSAALELSRFGVRVNCVSPAFCNTNLFRTAGLTELEIESIAGKERDTNPTGRAPTVEEVSQGIIHLTSQHARKITGQTINIDGGKHLTVRGQQAWLGTGNQQNKGMEVGESSGVVDFLKSKFSGANTMKVKEPSLRRFDAERFVELNMTSKWASLEESVDQNYSYKRSGEAGRRML
jgi:NADP-dependent 3-hydroxy acid dehydrogenase YdfG